MAAYFGLFIAALAAATILPFQSELVLVGLQLQGGYPLWALFVVASLGNILGSVINWGLGRGIARFRNKRWFPASEKDLARAEAWYHRYGRWSLLGAWLPFVGDPLTVVAGVLREPILPFLVLVTISKAGRYLFVIWAAQAWGSY
ncbi:MAG: YqaA family protein [Mangrovicoccus sp.]